MELPSKASLLMSSAAALILGGVGEAAGSRSNCGRVGKNEEPAKKQASMKKLVGPTASASMQARRVTHEIVWRSKSILVMTLSTSKRSNSEEPAMASQ